MTVAWYERDEIKDRLIIFGRAIQGTDPYEVVIEPDKARCHSGYCNFTARRIAVNPALFAVAQDKQYILTKALLIHEAGHRRYSTPATLPPLIHDVANVLEDERTDRIVTREFAAAGWFLRQLSAQFLDKASPIDSLSDSPKMVIRYCLQLRWANRCGQSIKGSLSPCNLALWEKIKPLVYDSWQASSSQATNRNAAEIVEILGLK